MSIVLVCLPSVDAGPGASYAYVRSSDSQKPDMQANAVLALLPMPERSFELVVVVPAAALSWHSVALPEGLSASSPRLRTVLGGLLEDCLLDDEDSLHLALAPELRTGKNGQTWVAACSKVWLHGHLQALESSQRPVARIVPEFAPDFAEVQLHAVGDADSAFWIATGSAVGGILRLPLSAAALSAMPALDSETRALVFSEPALVEQVEELIQTRATLQTRPQRWLNAARLSWDMAQFDLARSTRTRALKKVTSMVRDVLQSPNWRPARWGIAFLLVANLAGLNAWAWRQQDSLTAAKAGIQSILTRTFPAVKVIVDAPLQMQREVNNLRLASGALARTDLEAMLAALSTATLPDSRLSSIDFSAGELRLKGIGDSAQEAASITSQLGAVGYSAQLDNGIFVIKSDARSTP